MFCTIYNHMVTKTLKSLCLFGLKFLCLCHLDDVKFLAVSLSMMRAGYKQLLITCYFMYNCNLTAVKKLAWTYSSFFVQCICARYVRQNAGFFLFCFFFMLVFLATLAAGGLKISVNPSVSPWINSDVEGNFSAIIVWTAATCGINVHDPHKMNLIDFCDPLFLI